MQTPATACHFDLTRQVALRPSEQAALRRAGREFAQAASALLVEYLGHPTAIAFQTLAAPDPAAPHATGAKRPVWIAPEKPGRASLLWQLQWAIADGLLDAMLGCLPQGDAPSRPEPSSIDGALLGLLCRELERVARCVWPAAAATAGGTRCAAAPPHALNGSPDRWIALQFLCTLEDRHGQLTLYLPLAAAENLPGRDAHKPPPADALPPPTMRSAPVNAQVRLGTWRASVADLLSLQVGQVLELGVATDALLTLSVAGAEKFAVRPGQRNGKVSVEVVGPSPD